MACFKYIIISILAIGFIFKPLGYASNNHEVSSPNNILKLTEQTYQKLETYYDKGKILTEQSTTNFETFYKKNKWFFIKWSEYNSWGKDVFKNWLLNNEIETTVFSDMFLGKKQIKCDSLKDAIIKTLPISFGLLRNIPGQLFEDLGFKPISDMEDVRILGEDMVDNHQCVRLEIKDKRSNGSVILYYIWIEQNTYLIKKIKRISTKGEIIYLYETIRTNFNLEIQNPESEGSN